MKLLPHVIKPYISGLHLGSYTYLFSNILDHTVSRQQTMELIQKNPQLYIQSTVSNFIKFNLELVFHLFTILLLIIY